MKQQYPNILQTFGLLGIYILLSLGLAFVIVPLMDSMPKSLVTLLASVLSMSLVIFFALQLKNAPISYLFSGMKFASFQVYLVSVLFTIFMILVIDPITSLIPMPTWITEIMADLLQKDAYSFLTVAIAAPFFEELLFRKVVFEGYLQNYSPKKAIIMSAVMFAVFHLNPWQGIGAFVAGLYLAYVYLKTGDILLCMFIHFVNNGIGYGAFAYYDDPFFTISDVLTAPTSLALVVIIGSGGMYICYRYLVKHFELNYS